MKTKKQYNTAQKATLNMTLTGIMRVVSMMSLFLMKTILINTLGVQYVGVSSVFADLVMLFSFAELGIGSAIVFALYKPIEERDFRKIAQLMNFYKVAYRWVAIAIFLIGISLIPFLDTIITDIPDVKENIIVFYMLYLMSAVVTYFMVYRSSLLTANQENYKISLIQGTVVIIRLIFSAVILMIWKNLIMYLTIDILWALLQNFTIYLLSKQEFKEIDQYKHEKLPIDERNHLFKNVGALAIYQVANMVMSSSSSVVISTIFGTTVVAFYANYRLIIRSVDSLAAQITIAITPTFGNIAVRDKDNQKPFFSILNLFVYWMTLMSSLLIYFLTEPFITLWIGEDFIISRAVLMVMVLDYIVVNLQRPANTLRNANGLFTQGKFLPLVMALLNVIFSAILAYPFGLLGVMLGTVLARVLTLVWFDPVVVYKYIFKESAAEYFIQYFFRFAILVVTGLITNYANIVVLNALSVNNIFLKMLLIAVITLVISNLVFVLVFHRNTEFKPIVYKVKQIVLRK